MSLRQVGKEGGYRILLPALMLVLAWAGLGCAEPSGVAGLSHQEALRQGEAMYRFGILPSGEPMQAIVQGDIPVDGTMFSCESCHLRGGLGALEGKIITLPTNGRELYKPYIKAAEETLPKWGSMHPSMQPKELRPAYTDETLARVLWVGEDPAGRVLSYTMPRYELDERDMAILVYYLKNLSAELSPGVDPTTLRFATVYSEDADPQRVEVMLGVLDAHVRANNGQSRLQERRAKEGPFYKKKKSTAYRKWTLERWVLKGDPSTWPDQLEEYYRKQPVFALLGGMVPGSWQPIHEFCEKNRIPNVLPITDYPVISGSDWYTVYFSKGHYQEGEGAARFLRTQDEETRSRPIIQVFRDDLRGQTLAKGFRETWQLLGQSPAEERPLAAGAELDKGLLGGIYAEHPSATVLLWLEPRDLEAIKIPEQGQGRVLIGSARMLEGHLGKIPETLRQSLYLTYPYRLPEDMAKGELVLRSWLKMKKLSLSDLRVQSDMYFVGWMLAGVTMMMENDFFRENFLDAIDMMNDETYAIVTYPRLSFGQGQRYASKGCYLIQLGPGPQPELIPRSEWVIH
ncbi:c-type cytochrome [Desulfuromonas versatilis]|uniref:C-type cytochrome n=1 Tax=Desulfuromonas versatilis TaxID=2802975 RepID=A0ABM8HW76_9BACT|nr:amino acid ABC transporter substrate-binding protein [Desulfuromonas versatilis]BCR06566.1 c-type cytochrome [Desulfuromonas versatilis]